MYLYLVPTPTGAGRYLRSPYTEIIRDLDTQLAMLSGRINYHAGRDARLRAGFGSDVPLAKRGHVIRSLASPSWIFSSSLDTSICYTVIVQFFTLVLPNSEIRGLFC